MGCDRCGATTALYALGFWDSMGKYIVEVCAPCRSRIRRWVRSTCAPNGPTWQQQGRQYVARARGEGA